MDRESNYHCCVEWHMARLTPFAGILYSFMLRISKNSREFNGSDVGVADFYGVSRWKIQRAIRERVRAGFLVGYGDLERCALDGSGRREVGDDENA